MFSQGRPKKKRVGPEPDAKAICFLLLAAAAGAAALWRPPEEGMLSQENSFQPSLMNTAKAAHRSLGEGGPQCLPRATAGKPASRFQLPASSFPLPAPQ